MFADPKPTTLSGERPSAEALRDVMSRYFEVMRAALEAHGGTVEKFIGDAVMAVFGLPVRHEDDALRAVRGAAAMQAALPALNEEFRARWGIELGNHIGVNSGEVIAGDASLGQRLVTGDAVNTAARLEQAAGPQEVILGELTYRLARDQIEVEPIPPLTLKGKTEPVPAYRLIRVAQRPTERAEPTTPFVGREAEMSRLETALLEVAATRIVPAADRHRRRGGRQVAARARVRRPGRRARPFAGPARPLPAIRRWRHVLADRRDCAQRGGLSATRTRGRSRWPGSSTIARSTSGGGDDPAAIVDRVAPRSASRLTQFPGPELFWGIRKLLEAIASRRPRGRIVDDIHVAAPTFLELLDHLTDGGPRRADPAAHDRTPGVVRGTRGLG